MLNTYKNFRKGIFLFFISTIVALLVTDYKYFNNSKVYIDNQIELLDIIGNNVIPDQEIVSILNNRIDKNSIYKTIVNEIKTIKVSNFKKIVLVKEDSILFYDNQYYHTLSGNKFFDSNNLIDKKLYPVFQSETQNKKVFNQISFLTSYILNNHKSLYSELDSIKFLKDKKIIIKSNQCKIILIDGEKEVINKQNIRNKINILTSFNKQYKDTVDIKEIDLSWKNKIFVKSI